MGEGAALMLGWTILLIWADRKPMERKEILVITTIPVILLMVTNNLFGIASGFISFEAIFPTIIIQILLCVLFMYSYLRARHAE